MIGLKKGFNWLTGFVVCLFVTTIFTTTTMASYTVEKVTADNQKLVKEMNIVFNSIKGIIENNSLIEKEKQAKVIDFIKNYRYGPDKKDYFWINDLQGKMIMHPYIPDLNGKNVSNIRDVEGTRMFVEMIEISLRKGKGFVNYLWVKYEGETPIPKTSFVKLLKQWGWVIGTGMYLETLELFDISIEPSYLPPIDDRNDSSPV